MPTETGGTSLLRQHICTWKHVKLSDLTFLRLQGAQKPLELVQKVTAEACAKNVVLNVLSPRPYLLVACAYCEVKKMKMHFCSVSLVAG